MRWICASTLTLMSLGLHAVDSRLELRHREAGGVGYSQGYSTIDFLCRHVWEKSEILGNVRGHLFNNTEFAANVGMGWRYSISDAKYLFGTNVFYDFREGEHFDAHQVGAGLEFLSQHLDIRGNGYLPVGQTVHSSRRFDGFSGNKIIVKQKVVGTLPSAELEIGSPIITKRFYLAGGPYYLFRHDDHQIHLGNAWGGKLRLSIGIGRYVSLGAQVTYDRIFKTRAQGIFSINIPFGPSSKTTKRTLWDIPIARNEIIPLQSKHRRIPLYHGKKEDSFFKIVFVDNTFAAEGNGGFEKPFASLKEVEAHSDPGDVIYIFPGDGTPRNMDEGIILKENQILASSGAPLVIEEIVIPPMTPNESPIITNRNLDELVVTNPGGSHLSDFVIIAPSEYQELLGGFDSFLTDISPDSAPASTDAQVFEAIVDTAPLGSFDISGTTGGSTDVIDSGFVVIDAFPSTSTIDSSNNSGDFTVVDTTISTTDVSADSANPDGLVIVDQGVTFTPDATTTAAPADQGDADHRDNGSDTGSDGSWTDVPSVPSAAATTGNTATGSTAGDRSVNPGGGLLSILLDDYF